MMEPMSWIMLAGIVTSAITSIIGMVQGNKNVDKSLQSQREENQVYRESSRELAELQNTYNVQQWARDNAYNTPAAQKGRIKAAGLNPDMMYGGGLVNTSSGSPQMSAGSPAPPVDWSSLANKKTIGDTTTEILNNQLLQAQIDNINADTDKKGAETSILSSDASFREAWNKAQLSSVESTIRLQGKQIELSDQQIKESQARITEINAQVNQLNANVQQIHNAIKNDNARLDMEKLRNSAEVKRIQKECNLTDAQVNRLLNEWDYIVTQYNDAHDISILEQGRLEVTNSSLRMEGKMTYGAYDYTLTTWENVLKFLNQITKYASPFVRK